MDSPGQALFQEEQRMLRSIEGRMMEARDMLQSRDNRIRQLERENAQLREEAESKAGEAAQSRSYWASLQAQLLSATVDRDTAQSEARRLQLELDQHRGAGAAAAAAQNQHSAVLQAQVLQLQGQVAALQRQGEALRAEAAAIASERDALAAQLAQSEQDVAELQRSAQLCGDRLRRADAAREAATADLERLKQQSAAEKAALFGQNAALKDNLLKEAEKVARLQRQLAKAERQSGLTAGVATPAAATPSIITPATGTTTAPGPLSLAAVDPSAGGPADPPAGGSQGDAAADGDAGETTGVLRDAAYYKRKAGKAVEQLRRARRELREARQEVQVLRREREVRDAELNGMPSSTARLNGGGAVGGGDGAAMGRRAPARSASVPERGAAASRGLGCTNGSGGGDDGGSGAPTQEQPRLCRGPSGQLRRLQSEPAVAAAAGQMGYGEGTVPEDETPTPPPPAKRLKQQQQQQDQEEEGRLRPAQVDEGEEEGGTQLITGQTVAPSPHASGSTEPAPAAGPAGGSDGGMAPGGGGDCATVSVSVDQPLGAVSPMGVSQPSPRGTPGGTPHGAAADRTWAPEAAVEAAAGAPTAVHAPRQGVAAGGGPQLAQQGPPTQAVPPQGAPTGPTPAGQQQRQQYHQQQQYQNQQQQRQQQQHYQNQQQQQQQGPGYKYIGPTVRGRDKRDALPGHDCHECRGMYEALLSWERHKGPNAPGLARAAMENVHCDKHGGMNEEAAAAIQQLRQQASKHRALYARKETQEGFWDMGFMDSEDSRYVQQQEARRRTLAAGGDDARPGRDGSQGDGGGGGQWHQAVPMHSESTF